MIKSLIILNLRLKRLIKMRLLGYVRVSSEGQQDNTSIQNQINEINRYCDYHKHEVVIYQDVKSGKNLDRKGIKNLLNELSNFDGVIVYKIDRLSRKLLDTLSIVETLKTQNKTLISIVENLDISTIQGQLMLNTMSSFAQYEREVISQRVKTGKEVRKNQNKFTGGQVKTGYKSVKTFNNNGQFSGNELVKDDKEQEIIKLIKNHKRAGKGLTDISRWLNDNGYKTKNGKQFTYNLVRNILVK